MIEQEINNDDAKAVLKFIVASYYCDLLSKDLDNKLNISEKEQEVLRLVADGMNCDEIANKLYISKTSANDKIEEIFAKLGNKERTKAATFALKNKKFAL